MLRRIGNDVAGMTAAASHELKIGDPGITDIVARINILRCLSGITALIVR
jgi:hypothetical protein